MLARKIHRLSLLLALLLLVMPSARAEVKMERLTGLAGAQVYTDDNGIDTEIGRAHV